MSQSSAASELLTEVADIIKSSPNAVRTRLKDTLVEREITSRVDILDRGLAKLRDARNELKKMKPDQVSFADGGVKTENWSKEAYDKKVKAEEALEKLEKAMDAALNEGTFDKLKDMVK